MSLQIPKRIETEFDSDPQKIVMGPNHSAVITENGILIIIKKLLSLSNLLTRQLVYLRLRWIWMFRSQ